MAGSGATNSVCTVYQVRCTWYVAYLVVWHDQAAYRSWLYLLVELMKTVWSVRNNACNYILVVNDDWTHTFTRNKHIGTCKEKRDRCWKGKTMLSAQ